MPELIESSAPLFDRKQRICHKHGEQHDEIWIDDLEGICCEEVLESSRIMCYILVLLLSLSILSLCPSFARSALASIYY
jgi:hypothetical protein